MAEWGKYLLPIRAMTLFLLAAWAGGLQAQPASGAATLESARSLHIAGEMEAAAAAYRRFLATDPVPEAAATANNNLCVILTGFGDFHAAESACLAARELRRQIDDPQRLGRTLNNLGLVQQELGDYDAARDSYAEALAINRATADVAAQAVNLANLGLLETLAGRYGQAIEHQQSVIALAKQYPDAAWALAQIHLAHLNLGVVLEKLGAFREALESYRQIPNGGADLPARQQATLAMDIGVVYRNLGDPVSAVGAFERAARVYQGEGDNAGLANALLNQSLVQHLNLARADEAARGYAGALGLALVGGHHATAMQTLYYFGRLRLEQGDVPGAQDLFGRCLELSDSSGSLEGRWSALEGLARVAVAQQRLPDAVALLQDAMDTVESVRAGVNAASLRANYFSDQRGLYGLAVAVQVQLAGPAGGRGPWARAAWDTVQRARARELLDALGRDVAGYDAGGAGSPDSPDNDIRLEFYAAEGRLYRWSFEDGELLVRDRGSVVALSEHVAVVHTALAAGARPPQAALDVLSQALLGDMELRRQGVLRIVPAGMLQQLPFELLRVQGGESVLQHFAVSYLPSIALLHKPGRQRTTAAHTLAGFADAIPASAASLSPAGLLLSQFELQRLPAARDELTRIAALLPGEHVIHTAADATEENLRRALSGGVRVVHMATHAVFDEQRGTPRAAVVLSAAGSDDGLLYPEEIAALPFDVELTVLAACRTARGALDEGRSFFTLTGALLAAGSSAVLATLWDVDDVVTAVFMEQFYYELRQGRAPASALQRVKLRLSKDERWANPALWSAYVLIGDAAALNLATAQKRSTAFVLLLAVAALLLAAALWLRLQRQVSH